MDTPNIIEIFKAQTENVQELNKAWRQVNRAINLALRKGDEAAVSCHTKILALVFCAWTEASFLKLIHTPHGFEVNEIQQIKQEWEQSGIGSGWIKCLELGLRKANDCGKSNYIPNIRKTVTKIITEFVIEPSIIRNKIAHGQWSNALNKENTAINLDITTSVRSLDSVKIMKWWGAFRTLFNIIEILIESPNRAFHRDYWKEITSLEEQLKSTAVWNLQSKIKRLKKKPRRVH